MKSFCAVILVTGLATVTLPVRAEVDMNLQLSRYDQMIDRLNKQNEQLMGEVRQLQRDNLMLKKTVDEAQSRAQNISDDMQKLQNMTVGNLQTGQKQLAERVSQLNQKTTAWGDGTRDCADLKVKHQQIKVMTSPDGNRSVKFLCYDGKVLHLGTEVHDLGQ